MIKFGVSLSGRSFLVAALVATSGVSFSATTGFASYLKEVEATQRRIMTPAISFCGEQFVDADLLVRFETYVKATVDGTSDGFNEVAKVNKWFRPADGSLYDSEAIRIQLMQRDQLLGDVKNNPERGCKNLSAFIEAGTRDAAKQVVLTSFNEYLAKRRELCTSRNRPKNCTADEMKK